MITSLCVVVCVSIARLYKPRRYLEVFELTSQCGLLTTTETLNLKSVNAELKDRISNAAFWPLHVHLTLTGVVNMRHVLPIFMKKRLHMTFYEITDEDLQQLAPFPVHTLDLCNCDDVTDAGVAHLSSLPLHKLILSEDITNAGLTHLSSLPLDTLNMSYCYCITDAGVAHLSSLPLHTLDMSYCYGITDAGVAHLSSLPLHTLDMMYCGGITDAGVEYLASLDLHMVTLGSFEDYICFGSESD